MPRTLPPILSAAMDSGQFNSYFLLTVKEVGFGILFTVEPTAFKLSGIELTVTYPTQTKDAFDGFSFPQDVSFTLTRGITSNGVNYTIDSSEYFGVSAKWDGITETIHASMLPHSVNYAAPGDLSYKVVLEDLCAAFGKTAVFKNPSALWLDYQFFPAGKNLSLNKSSAIINLLKQKYIIYACDNGNNEILFCAVGTDTTPTDYTLSIERFNASMSLANYRRFVSRDENSSITYSGQADAPLWNLGFLPSTAVSPTFFASSLMELQPIAPHLKYISFDNFTFMFLPNYPNNLYDGFGIPLAWVEEEFDPKNKIAWRILIKSLDWASGSEGGALPGSIASVAAYTPLVSVGFDGNLDPNVNNLQALAQAVDDLPGILSAIQKTDLTGGGLTVLHSHSASSSKIAYRLVTSVTSGAINVEAILFSTLLPANTITVGKSYRIVMTGQCTQGANFLFRSRIGINRTIADTLAWYTLATTAQVLNSRSSSALTLTCRTIGATGTIILDGVSSASALVLPTAPLLGAGVPIVVNTTVNNYLSFSVLCTIGVFTANTGTIIED